MLALAVCLLLTLPAFGDVYVIDFLSPLGAVAGSITGTPITGTDISIAYMRFTVNGFPPSLYAVTGACGGGLYGCLDFDTTVGSTSLTVVGKVPSLFGLGTYTALSGTTLLSGTITSAGVTAGALSTDPNIFNAVGPDTKLPDLLSALGVPAEASFAYASTDIYYSPSGSVNSASVSNTASVPDGGLTGMLLGGVLIGIEALRRRVRV